jgi:hypothetical protein
MKKMILIWVLLLGLLLSNLHACSENQPLEEEGLENTQTSSNTNNKTYVESNGILSVEFEKVKDENNWQRGSSIDGYDGEGYLLWSNPDSFQTPGNGILTYKLNITTTGTYLFIWRSRIAHGESQSEANDSWLRFKDASDFYGRQGNSIVYPKGIGKSPNPNGSSAAGWFKIYMNRLGEWFWRSNTSDNDPHDIYVTFSSPGIYTMEVSGRSQHHALDRFLLFKNGITFEEAESAARSEIIIP